MKFERNHVILVCAVLVGASFFMFFKYVNNKISNRVTVALDKIQDSSAAPKQTASISEKNTEHKEHVLKETDLSPYSITSQGDNRILKSQQFWDNHAKKTIGGGAPGGGQWTPDQIDRQISRIDGRIREFQGRVQYNPDDEYAQRKLQGLYMMRSTMKTLRENVINK